MPAKTVKPRCLSRIRSITRLVSRCTLARSALLTSRVKRLRPDLSPRALVCASSAAARRRRRCKRRSRLSTRLVSRPASARSAATTIRLTMPPKARWHRACVLASRAACLSRLFASRAACLACLAANACAFFAARALARAAASTRRSSAASAASARAETAWRRCTSARQLTQTLLRYIGRERNCHAV